MAPDVKRCPGHPGSVDLVVGDPAHIDPIHLTAAEWQEFVTAIKAGMYDDVTRHLDAVAGGAHKSRGQPPAAV
jgi:hypothetical protein